MTCDPPPAPETDGASNQQRLAEIRTRISDIGYEIDAGKAVMALMVGGGVFMLLLVLLAGYDLLTGHAGIYAPLGITREVLKWVAFGGTGFGAAALVQAMLRRKLRDRNREIELARLEEEYARLLENEESQPE